MKKSEKVYPKTVPIELNTITFWYSCPTTQIVYSLLSDRMEFNAIYSDCDLCGPHGITRLEWMCACGDWHEITLTEQ